MFKNIGALVAVVLSSNAMASDLSDALEKDLAKTFSDSEIRFTLVKSSADINYGGENEVNADVDSIGIALRNNLTKEWASEIKYTVEGEDNQLMQDGEVSRFDMTSTLSLSGIYKHNTIAGFTPYIKLGVGVINADFEGFGSVKEFTYVAGAGIDYAMSEIITLGAEYEYFGEIDFSDEIGESFSIGEMDMSRISLGLSVSF